MEREASRVCRHTCSTSSPTSTTTVYTYDGDGLRTSATIGSTTTNFTWGTIASSSRLVSDGAWDFIYTPGAAAPLEQIATSGSSPTTNLLLSDESGNTRGLVQLSSGTHYDQLVNYTDYDAYSTPITQSGGSVETGGLTTSQTSINSNYVGSTPWGFGEGYSDPTGLIYLISRYYDPASGQFLSVDPLVSQTMQPYEYAGENPMAHTDPSGQSAYGCIGLDPQNGFTLCFGIDGSGQTVLQMSVYVFDRSQYYQGTQYFFAALAITGARHKILTVDKVELKSAYIIWMPEEWELFIVDFIPYHVFAPGQYCGVWVGPPPNNTRIGNEKNGACESVET